MREGKVLMFVSHLVGHTKDIHVNTVSGWVRKLIQFCYEHVDSRTAKLQGTSTHTIRGLASTLAFKGSASLEDIMSACSWKSHNTFSSFYLEDVAGIMDDLYKLGPISVAQSVLVPQ